MDVMTPSTFLMSQWTFMVWMGPNGRNVPDVGLTTFDAADASNVCDDSLPVFEDVFVPDQNGPTTR